MQSLFIQQDHKLLQVLKKYFSELWARNVACPQSMTQKRVKIYTINFFAKSPYSSYSQYTSTDIKCTA